MLPDDSAMNSLELDWERCPLCDSDDMEIQFRSGLYAASCKACGISTSLCSSPEAVLEIWNTTSIRESFPH
jgi:transcription elongation factor Elf1